jgi:hypothetical protein
MDLRKSLNLDEVENKLKTIEQIIENINNNKWIDTNEAKEHGMGGAAASYDKDLQKI